MSVLVLYEDLGIGFLENVCQGRNKLQRKYAFHFSRIVSILSFSLSFFRFLRSTRRGIIKQSPRNGKSGRRWFKSFNYGQSVNHGGRFSAFQRVNRFDETNLSVRWRDVARSCRILSRSRSIQPILSSIFSYPSSPRFRSSAIIYAESL